MDDITLNLWLLGFGIPLSVLEDPILRRYVAEKDGVSAFRQLQKVLLAAPHGERWEQHREISEAKYQLEFITIVQGNPTLFE